MSENKNFNPTRRLYLRGRSCNRMDLAAHILEPQAILSEVQSGVVEECCLLKWHVLYTCPRHEKSVALQVEQRSIACFLPTYRSMRRWKGRRKELELALFPGYVFVRLALSDRLRVLQLPSAVRLVSFNGRPAVLPDSEIESLRARLSGHGARIEPHPYLCAGRRVRVCAGPMLGLEGIVVRRKDRCRVVFSLDLIMRSVAVEVDASDLEPVGDSKRRH